MKRLTLFALLAIAALAITGCASTYQATYSTSPAYYPYYEPWPDYATWWPGPYYAHGRFHEHHGFARGHDGDHDFDDAHAFSHHRGYEHEGRGHMGHRHVEFHESHHHG